MRRRLVLDGFWVHSETGVLAGNRPIVTRSVLPGSRTFVGCWHLARARHQPGGRGAGRRAEPPRSRLAGDELLAAMTEAMAAFDKR
jgi:hypothetical protein